MCNHHHNHEHHHDHSNRKILTIAFVLTLLFTITEIVSGFLFKSLALISDGTHMLSDSLSLFLSMIAIVLGSKKPSLYKTFGYKRIEVLAALFNGLLLLGIPIFIFIEALQRLKTGSFAVGKGMFEIAIFGLIINITVAFVLSRGNNRNINVKSALIHVFSDILSCVGTLVASLCIIFLKWSIADIIVSVIVSIFIFKGGLQIIHEVTNILMEGAPHGINATTLSETLKEIKDIKELKRFHVWSIASGIDYANIHVLIKEESSEQKVLVDIKEALEKYHLNLTIQIEK